MAIPKSIPNSLSINIFNKPSQSQSLSQPPKTKLDFLYTLKKKKEHLNNTIFAHDFILAKESTTINVNNSNKNMTNITTISPLTPDKINNKKTRHNNIDNKDNKAIKSLELLNKILPIKQQWNSEMKNIIKKGYNGYLQKKFNYIYIYFVFNNINK